MKVEMTKVLEAELHPEDASELVGAFEEWKHGDEFKHYWFGKDGAYRNVYVGLKDYTLMHVHLVPVTDEGRLALWDRAYDRGVRNRRGAKKTSNRVLVYVGTPKQDRFLLIFVLPEPDAHRIAEQRTSKDREQMKRFAKIAEEYLDSGKIIA